MSQELRDLEKEPEKAKGMTKVRHKMAQIMS
jgi:hypothetical protein